MKFDPRDPELRRNPYPIYRNLRETDPVHYSDFGFVILSRYADIETVLRAPGVSSEFYRSETWANRRGGPNSPIVRSVQNWMLMLDGPAHRRIRGVIGKVFTRASVERRREFISAETERLVGAMGEGIIDLIDAIALPLPVSVTCDLLGLPVADKNECRAWTEHISRIIDPSITEEDSVDINRAEVEFSEYILGHLDKRRSEPADDILTLLLNTVVDGERLTDAEIVANVEFLFVAGHETTVNLIGNSVLALLRHPDQLAMLRANPGMISEATDEFARYDPPVQIASRILNQDVVVDGQVLGAGSKVMLLFGAAGRDPEHYPNPDCLDVTRQNIKNLAFSGGPHYCLGAALGKLETAVVLTALLERYPAIELASEELVWRPNVSFRGVERLELALHR